MTGRPGRGWRYAAATGCVLLGESCDLSGPSSCVGGSKWSKYSATRSSVSTKSSEWLPRLALMRLRTVSRSLATKSSQNPRWMPRLPGSYPVSVNASRPRTGGGTSTSPGPASRHPSGAGNSCTVGRSLDRPPAGARSAPPPGTPAAAPRSRPPDARREPTSTGCVPNSSRTGVTARPGARLRRRPPHCDAARHAAQCAAWKPCAALLLGSLCRYRRAISKIWPSCVVRRPTAQPSPTSWAVKLAAIPARQAFSTPCLRPACGRFSSRSRRRATPRSRRRWMSLLDRLAPAAVGNRGLTSDLAAFARSGRAGRHRS